jgi:hypothetical protein
MGCSPLRRAALSGASLVGIHGFQKLVQTNRVLEPPAAIARRPAGIVGAVAFWKALGVEESDSLAGGTGPNSRQGVPEQEVGGG